MHAENSFVTLTYRPEDLPPGGTLVPKHTQNWFKRLRKELPPSSLRYYLVGEYGDQSQRPHYHAAIFGLGPQSSLFQETWKKGRVYPGTLTPHSAQYIAGYVTKKLTKKDDPALQGRHPEFARMSNRPGIAATSVPDIALVLTTDPGCNSILASGDVPLTLSVGKSQFPLGRYLRRKLREQLGFKETSTPKETLLQLQVEMSRVLQEALTLPENRNKTCQQIFVDLNKQQALNMETRQKIFSKKGSI